MTRLLLAFAWLRWRLLLNGLRGSRRRDRLEQLSRVAAVLAPAFLVVPFGILAVGLAVLGFRGGQLAASGETDAGIVLLVARGILATLLALPVLVPLGRASQGASRGSARLLLLPIPRGALHLVEVIAALADPWIAFVIPGLAAFALGVLTAGRPVLAVVALASGAAFLAATASLASLMAHLSDWLMRDRRRGEVFTLLFVVLVSIAGMLPAVFSSHFEKRDRDERARTPEQRVERVFDAASIDEKLPAWTAALPSELYARSVRMELEGRSDRSLLLLAALVAEAAVLFRLSSAAHRKVLTATESGRSRRRASAVRLRVARWPFLSREASAVAVVQAKHALRSVRGRLAVLLPGPMFALIGLLGRRMPEEMPFGEAMARGGHTVLAIGCLFSLYALQAFHLNQFASDRAGLSLSFLAPVSDLDLVRGKAVGGAVVYAVGVLLCVVCVLFATGAQPTVAWLSVLLAAAATYALFAPVAAALSATLPKTADLSRTGKGGNPHGLAVLIGTFCVMALSVPPSVVLWVVGDRMHRPGVALTLIAAWAAVAVVAAGWALRPVARIVHERRENLALVAAGR